jgi:hypothetical protein
MARDVAQSGVDTVDPLRAVWRRYLAVRRERRISAFLRAACAIAARSPADGKRAAVFISPWPAWEQAPDYMIIVALALRSRGVRAELVWDDMLFDGEGPEVAGNARIAKLVSIVHPVLSVTRLSRYARSDDSTFQHDPTIAEFARLNAYKHYRCETLDESGHGYQERIGTALEKVASALSGLFADRCLDYMVAVGGLYRSTSVLVHVCRKAGIRIATLDAGPATMLVSTNGVAAYLDDVPGVVDSVKHLDPEWDVRVAADETLRRQRGEDRFSYQAVPASRHAPPEFNKCVLIALNQSFDTSALGRHAVYQSQTEWMMRSVEWLLSHSRQLIVVRRHPVERKRLMRSDDDYGGMLMPYIQRHPSRLFYVDENATVSTYDILRSATMVLVHTSSVGMEATMMGVPVVTQSGSAYSRLGFVWHADTEHEYHDFLAKGVGGELLVTDEAKASASRCYYITQCCNFAHVPEAPNALPTWRAASAPAVLSSPQLHSVLQSIDSGVPLAFTRYMQFRNTPGPAAHDSVKGSSRSL